MFVAPPSALVPATDVLARGYRFEMGRVATPPMWAGVRVLALLVTGMTYMVEMHAVWDRAYQQLVGDPMHEACSELNAFTTASIGTEVAVAVRLHATGPRPALVAAALIDLRPEPTFVRVCCLAIVEEPTAVFLTETTTFRLGFATVMPTPFALFDVRPNRIERVTKRSPTRVVHRAPAASNDWFVTAFDGARVASVWLHSRSL